MNVTELARRLKVPTKQLREMLPKLGFDVGQKAIKIEKKLAQSILRSYRRLLRDFEKKEEYRKKKEADAIKEMPKEDKTDVEIPKILTVKEFAAILSLPINKVIAELMRNGIMASLNERIDHETAAIIGGDIGYNVTLKEGGDEQDDKSADKLKGILETSKASGIDRAPVIVIMGHVDHGKTKLLDTIRQANVIDSESGGITQHIGAYQAIKNDRLITFIDTPGHEAFTAMRSRGAKVADIAILIVAADDSVKTQTIEAIRIIQAAKLPLIVAINKIDKEGANIDKVKTDLSHYKLIPEDWGGDTIMAEISALSGKGVDSLLDMILLTADMQKEDIKADPVGLAAGTIIESHIDKGEGIVSTVLVQTGTLKKGDIIGVNGNYYGRVRLLKDHNGKVVSEATPSMPVKIIGLKIQPRVGDLLEVAKSEKAISKKIKKYALEKTESSSILLQQSEDDAEAGKQILPIVLKADVLGSLEAIIESLEKIQSEHIKVQIISKGLGNITESDLQMAQTSNALMIGFHTKQTPGTLMMARERSVEILPYEIIYKLIEDVKRKMEERIGEEIIRHDFGNINVAAIFKTEKSAMIIGGKVVKDEIRFEPTKYVTKVIVTRKGEYITEGVLEQLQSGKQTVKDVHAGQECGIRFVGQPLIEVDDVLELYMEENKKRVL